MNIQWGPPYTVREGFATKWRREWCIPEDKVSGFFGFWRRNRFKLLADGFTVSKSNKTGKWYLYETKDDTKLFKIFGELPQKPEDTFALPSYSIKDTSGLRPWQIEAAGKLCAAINHWGAAIDGSDTGCHAKGQLILMADGNIKKVEDIVVGDKVMGWKGPQTVTELKRGRQQMVKIVPNRGSSFIVNMDHILSVYVSYLPRKIYSFVGGTIVDLTVREFLNLPLWLQRRMMLFGGRIDCWEDKQLPFSPYLIGALLGDGGMSQRTVTFTNTDKEVWDYVVSECNSQGWVLRDTNEEITKRITNAPPLYQWMRKVNLLPCSCENKYIPFDYKTGSVHQRLQLLAGILDTDGSYYLNGNGYEITLKSQQLSNDIVFIARSLGFAAYCNPCKKTCTNNGYVGTYFRTHISGNVDEIPCQISRKIARQRKTKKDATRNGFSIEILGEDDFYGFSLDGDGRFFSDEFVVLHNTGKTYSAVAVARELDLKICVVCPKAVIKSWGKVIKNHFKMKDRLVGIINYEKLRTGRKDSDIASYILHRHEKRAKFEWKLPKKTLIIWDESQKLKNWKTQNSKTCQAAIKAGYPMLFCSATNATNPLEMRAVGLALKIYKNGNSYYEWAYDNGVYKGNWGLEFNNDPKILKRLHHQIFDQRGVRLRRDDIPGFPACEIIPEVYNMDEQDANQINEIFADMERELEIARKREKADQEKAKKLNKELQEVLIQLRARQKIELVKVPLFVDMIEEALEEGLSVAVFVNFTETINALAARLNTKCIFDGKTPDKVRDRNVELFQEDKERVILVNIQSGGAGLSLHDLNGNFPRMSIISPSYSPVFMRQALGRIWRDDAKTKSIQRIVCVANTVEENVCRNVQQKLNNLDLLNDGDLALSKNYEIISD